MHYRIILTLLGFTLWLSELPAQQVRFSLDLNQTGWKVFELPPRLDIVTHFQDQASVDIVAPIETFENLKQMGLNPRLIEVQKPNVDPSYLTPAEVTQFLLETAYRYPEITHLEEIGRTTRGEPIWAMRLSSKDRLDEKPAIVFNAMHHARELMTTEVAIDIIQFITENSGNIQIPEVAEWLSQLAIWVIPQINPDGNWIVWKNDSWWRKNAWSDSNGVWGVDLNRNYPYRWGDCRGSSWQKHSQTFRGESPASEPETQAFMRFSKKINPVINISYHSYSELVISPYGCRGDKPTEVEIIDSVGSRFASLLKKDFGQGSYDYGPAWDELYPVDGDDISWLHQDLNVLAYVVEIGSSRNGFQPDYKKWRNSMVARQRPGWIYLLQRLMTGPQVRLKFFSATTGQAIDASVRISGLEYGESEKARQSRNGFMTKILNPGVYDLIVEAKGHQTDIIRVSVGDYPEFLNIYLQETEAQKNSSQ